ncbi:TonB-linked outer membrane protein, SusC/RagA family [Filimonas lacunae]|uniref:TonB-linked outer membrane protein, SusC/RagA family n=2 Tax=Filimonas lacunae TaxID=477680 RepID=A0A173MNC8_9BACT|nr:TonB-dependent receptor [Filimonas lacunae]BAV08901.1 TonB-dependent receptor [Filimonas lacunae]SIS63698.1 TonB-linked outer membrane protein, SusC/RagA family [Filimonas lacunae]
MKKNQREYAFFRKSMLWKITVLMKLTLLLTFAFCLNASANLLSQTTVSLKVKKMPLNKVLLEIEQKTSYRFLFNNESIPADKFIDLDIKDEQLNKVLDKILANTSLTYKILEEHVVVIMSGESKKDKIKARVLDSKGLPVQGVSVVEKGTTNGAVTDADGWVTLNVNDATTAVLEVKALNYQMTEIAVSGKQELSVSLKDAVAGLDEIVVIGYGAQKRSSVTAAVSSVKSDVIATTSAGRIDQALQGRTPGVSVLPASGSPGSAMRITIRGVGTNGSSNPLYIIDGVRAGGIEYLDPSEIASVDVLKDASAAIYGMDGANGVIIITTKTGKKNSSEITYNMQYARQSVGKKMEMMNAKQYQEYLTASNTTNAPTAAAAAAVGNGTTWMDQVFETAPLMRHTLAFSGGSDKTTYLIDGTYYTQNGIIGGDKAKFDRYTVRVNTESKVKPWLTVGERFSYANFKRNGIAEDDEFGSVLSSAIVMDPLTPVVFPGALSTRAADALAAGYTLVQNPQGKYYGISDYIFGEYGNPLAMIQNTHSGTVQNKVVGNVYANLEPVKDLVLTSRFGIDAAFQKQHSWTPTFWFSPEKLNTLAGGADKQDNWFTWQWENFATYTRKFGSHNFSFLGGTSIRKSSWNYVGGSYSGLFRETDGFSYGDNAPDLQDRIGSSATITTQASFYGRVSYDYKNKYLLQALVRRDASSDFAAGHKWATFPFFSAGWVLSNENFFGSVDHIVNYAKVRGSWGKNGSSLNVGPGKWQNSISPTTPGYPTDLGTYLIGAAPTNLANPDLTWEISQQTDIGVDLAFLNNKLSVSVDYYNKQTKNLITPGAGVTPLFAGNTLSLVNSGNVLNRGWEFDVSFRGGRKDGFHYEVGGNLSTIHNEVLSINRLVNQINGAGVGTGWTASIFKPGYPVWYFNGYKTDGIFQNQQQIDAYLAKTGLTGYAPKPGDPIVLDVNGDKQLSNADQSYMGSPLPKFVYGFRINMAYKGFDVIAFLQGQHGNDILMGFNRTDRSTANKPAFFYNDRWTGEGSTNKWFAPNTNSVYVYNSDLMVFKGSYARIRQLQLGYTLPKSLADKAALHNVRIYVSLDDFFTFTKYPGLDPEAGSNDNNSLGIDRGVYPIPRKAMVGLTLSF